MNVTNELGIRFSEAIELLLLEHKAHLIIVTELINLSLLHLTLCQAGATTIWVWAGVLRHSSTSFAQTPASERKSTIGPPGPRALGGRTVGEAGEGAPVSVMRNELLTISINSSINSWTNQFVN